MAATGERAQVIQDALQDIRCTVMWALSFGAGNNIAEKERALREVWNLLNAPEPTRRDAAPPPPASSGAPAETPALAIGEIAAQALRLAAHDKSCSPHACAHCQQVNRLTSELQRLVSEPPPARTPDSTKEPK